MKKFFLLPLLMLAMINVMSSCSDDEPNGPQGPTEPITPGNGSILVAYFSYPEPDGVDASTGASRLVIDETVTGHVEFLAGIIQDAADADIFRIETVQQYPASHAPLIAQAQEELNNGVRPALKTSIENLDQYDVIFIGYPNWWGNLPAPLYTFLESYDFAGKTIVPFNSHGGSGLSSTVATIRGIQPDADVRNGFTVSRNSVDNATNDVLEWLRQLEVVE